MAPLRTRCGRTYTLSHTVHTNYETHLGSTAARLKLKGIDGGPHKRRSMWINSMQREEPYLGLTCTRRVQRWAFPCGWWAGGAWLSSARVVGCWVKSRNERNPCSMLPARNGGGAREDAPGHT